MRKLTRKVLVTGASGFLGSHMVKSFVNAGWHVYAGMRTSSDSWRLKFLLPDDKANFIRTELDLRDPDTIRIALEDTRPKLIVHCAAYGADSKHRDMAKAIAINIMGTAYMVYYSKRVGAKRFVHVGTCLEYGDHSDPIKEDIPLRPRGIYGSTKAAASIVALERAKSVALPIAVIRPYNIYGPLDGSHKFIPQVILGCLTQSTINLTPGEQIRDYVYVDDVVRACFLLAECDPFFSGEEFNIGSGRPITIRTLGETVADVVGNGRQYLQWGAIDYRSEEVMHIVANASKASKILGWQARMPLKKGLQSVLTFEKLRRKK